MAKGLIRMWTRKAAFSITGGISLVLIGMMISNFQLMVIGLTFVAFTVLNGWIKGHGNVEVQRILSADNAHIAFMRLSSSSLSGTVSR